MEKFDLDVAEQVAEEILDEIVELGGELLYEHYIEARAVPFSVNTALAVAESGLEALYMRHDLGEPEIWAEDQEPAPCKIDTWARSAVPQKRKVKLRPVQEPSAVQPAADNRSMRSYRSGVTNVRNPRGVKTMNSTIQPIDEQVYQPVPIEVAQEVISEEEELMRQRKERQHKREKDEIERLKKIKQEQDEKQRKHNKETEELKNKPFTFDTEGNIVMINPPKYDKMPPIAMNVKYVVPEPEETAAKPPPRARREVEPAKPRKPVPASEQDFVKNITAVQPPIFDNIKLNPGVSVAQGSQSKYAPVQTVPGQTMTRMQYQQLAKKQEARLVPETPQDYERHELHSPVSPEEQEDPQVQSRKHLLEEIPDFEVSGQIPEEEEEVLRPLRKIPAASLLQQNRITHYTKGVLDQEDLGPVGQFNLEIMKNRNWGINPPIKQAHLPERIPKRPSERNIRETHGDKLKKPKDQPFISPKELWETQANKLKKPRDRPYIERVEKKTRMPPPPFGQTMAHVEERARMTLTSQSSKHI